MAARKGKIAQLPFDLREQLNQRLLDGEQGGTLLVWLNARGETAEAARRGGWQIAEITDGNLSEWRQGGFADWCADLKKITLLERKTDFALRLARMGNVSEIAAQNMAAELLAVLDADDVAADAEEGGDAPDKIGLALAAAKLLDASAKSRVAGVAEGKLELDKTKVEQAAQKIEQALSKLKLEWQKFAGKFVDWYEDQRAKTIMETAGSSRAEKIAALADLFGEMPEGIGPAQL
jgi:nicotinamide mononucleotide (NMN) deamidase PncC